MLTDEQIAKIASTPCAVVGSYVHTFARAIEAEVRKEDEALIRRLLVALEKAASFEDECAGVTTAARARLGPNQAGAPS